MPPRPLRHTLRRLPAKLPDNIHIPPHLQKRPRGSLPQRPPNRIQTLPLPLHYPSRKNHFRITNALRS